MTASSARPRFRVIDTGVRDGRENVAFDQAMIELHQLGRIPDSIRFLRFPPTVLIGRHQALSQEVNVAYCRAHGIGLARRITGGGAIYFDPGQLGWALVFHRRSLGIATLESLTREICEAAAAGLSRLGIEARYRPRNDIEVDGRKISGTGGFFDGDTLFYQGTVLVDMSPADMLAALRVPAAKLGKRGIDSVASRIVTLQELLGTGAPDLERIRNALLAGFTENLGLVADAGVVTTDEESAARRIHTDEVGADDFVFEIDAPADAVHTLAGTHTCAGGTINVYLRLEGPRMERIRELLVTGDFFVTPPRIILDLEAALRGVAADRIGAAVATFFEAANVDVLSVTPADFTRAITAALAVREPL